MTEYLPIENPGVKAGVISFDEWLESILDAMLEIAREHMINKGFKAACAKEIQVFNALNSFMKEVKVNTLATTPVAQCVSVAAPQPAVKKEKGNKPMCYECDCDYDDDCCSTDTVTEKKVNYLKGRAFRIKDYKQTELRKKFSMDSENSPKTPEELVERFKEGRFTVMEKDKRVYWMQPFHMIIWRDPKVPADPVGYEAALEELEKEYTKVIDAIMVMEAPEALKAVQEFESSN